MTRRHGATARTRAARHGRPLLVLTLLGTLTLPAGAGAQEAASLEARVDELMAEYDGDGPGAVVAVVEDGRVRLARAYGMASLEHGVPLTRTSVLDIGSVSKQFTAFAIALLVERGELSLDDDIRTHLPEVPDFGHTITVRHLVHHMSGLREIYNSRALEGYQGGDGISQEDAIHLIGRMRELNFEPGDEYLYCNTGYMLLADIVARVTDMPFAEFMEENVFGPVGMTHTTIMAERGQSIPHAAESYGPADDDGYRRIFDNSGIQGAGGVYTTVDDLAAWMSNWSTAAVGGPRVRERMVQRGVLDDGDTLSYAFGVSVGERRGLDVISHGGSSAGYRASFTYLPELDGGVVTLSNFAGFDGDIPDEILDAAFGDRMEAVAEEDGNAADGEDAAADPTGAPEVAVDEAVLESYVGRYELRPGMILHVIREGTTLYGEPTGQRRARFRATSDSTFDVEEIAALTFHRESDGTVTGATLHQNGDHPLKRLADWAPTPEYLATLAGTYYSPELETVYTLVIEDGALVARHRRHDDFEMEPNEEDAFSGAGFFGTARFERNDAGEVTGMRVTNGRVRNLWFEKVGPDFPRRGR